MASLTTAAVRQSLHGLRTRVNALPVLRGTTGSGHLGRVPRLLSTTEAPPALADSESSSSCADWNSARLEINVPGKSWLGVQQRRFVSSTHVPDFSAYKKPKLDESKGRAFTYVMVGTTAAVSAVGTKNFVSDFLTQLAPGADVMALAKAEVNLEGIPRGKNVTIKWRGKPVFIRHRTPREINEANSVQLSELRDPQTDSDRAKNPDWLVVLGICTHLGCVPIGEAGDYHGWYCPCHGSHYDISGRIRKGPAPLNLEVPPYDFNEDGSKLIIG